MRKLLTLCGLTVLLGVSFGPGAYSKEQATDDKPTFERDVLPIFKAKCWQCHSGRQPKAGLDLSSRSRVLIGGKSGPAIRRAAAESSLLWERIAAGEMPLKGEPLSKEEKGIIRTWINEGALGKGSDDEAAAPSEAGFVIDDEDRQFWSFRPPRRSALPAVNATGRVRNPIDAFILEKLEAVKLTLSPEADRATLIRRASYDLLGLPPAPEDVRAFIADPRPDAYEQLIDRLLASPAYGERWGRHWLDLAGYADSAGILWEDRPLPLAYRYRDYVIRALNKDKPYDRFLQEQIAGDELVDYWQHFENDDALSDEIIEAITATGYLRCAPDASRPDFSTIKNADAQYFYPTINDTMKIVATSTMGMTIQCARCHNHMFDPIPQEDFFRIQAVFMGAFRPTHWIPQMERRLTTLSQSQLAFAKQRNKEVEAKTKNLEDQIAKLRATYKKKANSDESDAAKLDAALSAQFAEYKQSVADLREQIAAERRRWYYYDEIRATYDLPGEVPTPFLRRGDPLMPAQQVAPGALTVLKDAVPFDWNKPTGETKTSGRRLAFARWLTNARHPLTPRVMANRLWLQHFGRGIVSTPDDFGHAGSPPSHPELLDWLAVEFVESGWSIKHMHRLMMTSSTYRQQSNAELGVRSEESGGDNPQLIDPDNRLLWRANLRRLEAESLRDAVLFVSGIMNTQMFGSPVATYRWANGEVTVANGADPRRRSIYVQNRRLYPLTMLNAFDQPVMETNCTLRSQSTVSTQALTLLNSRAMNRAAEAFAERVLSQNETEPAARAMWLAFGRAPVPDEREVLTKFLHTQQARHAATLEDGAPEAEARRRAVVDMCHMLLSANEFIYID